MEDTAEPDEQADPISLLPLSNRVVTIEHPCVVRNIQDGLKSLGGEAQLKQMLEHRIGDSQTKVNGKINVLPEPTIGVSLRPKDPFAKRIPSFGINTRNVLVRVTVPKWTGRKRKRGAQEPFATVPSDQQTPGGLPAPSLVRHLSDNAGAYQARPIQMLRETHRFRNLPDLQLHTGELAVMREVRDTIMSAEYDKLAQFKVDLTPGPSRVSEFPGPPQFLGSDQPYWYGYQQAPGVVFQIKANGERVSVNTSAAPRRSVEAVPYDIETVPLGPPANLKIPSRDEIIVPKAIEDVQKLLETRPMVSKRVLAALLPNYSDTILKIATQWTGYSFKNGAFHNLHIKYGVDPRSDPKFRVYQCLTFHVDPDVTSQAKRPFPSLTTTPADTPSYLFDGLQLSGKGKTWQVCDITDEVLKALFETSEIRSECDIQQYGWYPSFTITKVRIIMRDKIKRLNLGERLPPVIYRPLLTYLNGVDSKEMNQTALPNESLYDKVTVQLALEIRRNVRLGPVTRRQSGTPREPGQSLDQDEEPTDTLDNQDDASDLEDENVDDGSGAESD